MRSRGDVQLLMIVALAGCVVSGIAYFLGDWRGHTRGEASKQAEWDRQKLADLQAGQLRAGAVLRAIDNAHEKAASAEKAAADSDSKWKEAQRANRGRPMASCQSSSSAQAPLAPVPDLAGQPAGRGAGQDGVARGGDDRVVLHWRYVGMHDGAFTGLDGQPLFRDSSDFALNDSRADTPSPYGLEELLEVNGENARALSSCRRAYAQALDKLDAAAAAWEKKQ